MEHGKYYKLIKSDAQLINFNFREVWQYRDLIQLLVKRDFVSKYKQTILGPAWAIIQPLLTTFVFTFVFGNVAGLAECGAVPTFLFYMSGNIAWTFFSGCLTETSNTFINNAGTMGKVYFPRLCVPIATTLSQLISFMIQAVMFVIFLAVYLFIPTYKIDFNVYAVMIPLHILQLSMLGLGCGIIISALTTKYRDLRFLVSFGVSLWMYGTPVAYSIKIFGEGTILYQICRFNPVTPIIQLIRFGCLGSDAGNYDQPAYVASWIVTFVLTLIGITMFNKVERTFMDTV